MTRTHPVRSIAIAVLTTGVIGTATVALDAATARDAGPAPEPVAHAPVLELFPAPLDCLLTTGFALFCLSGGTDLLAPSDREDKHHNLEVGGSSSPASGLLPPGRDQCQCS